MKVVCIDNNFRQANNLHIKVPIPVLGEIYTVIKVRESTFGTLYGLAEFGIETGYDATAFIPISDIDETTFERNYQKELV